MSNLLLRVLTAVVLGPLVVYLAYVGGLAFTILILVTVGASLYEYLAMVEGRTSVVAFAACWILGVGLAWGSTTQVFIKYSWILIVGGVCILLLVHLLFPGQKAPSFNRAAAAVTGLFYAGALPACLLHLRLLDKGWAWVFLAMMITWGSDTMAYFSGRAFGKHKLYPLVSPGKTWEGAIGGLTGSVIASLLAWLIFFPELGPLHAILVALVAGPLAQMGDLVESMLKRSMGFKDSGKLLPGHGGMLDRIDGLIFATPAILIYAVLVMGWGSN